jgi:hypothetical protein
MSSKNPPPRIVKIRYRSGINGRVAIAFAKVPYSGLFDLSEKMARLLHQRQVRWYRIEEAKPEEIEIARPSLVRWPEALRQTVGLTKVDLNA